MFVQKLVGREKNDSGEAADHKYRPKVEGSGLNLARFAGAEKRLISS
jgi:hypothetical protein